MKALGLDIFAGGFTLGVKKYFDVVCHLEETSYGEREMLANQPEIPVFVGADAWPTRLIKDEHGPIDFIYGNPPCAAWSPIGRVIQAGSNEAQWATDPRVDCTRILFNALRYFEPTVWAWESVPQAYTRGRPFVHELTRCAWDLGYNVTYVLHNAMYLGARQHRKRFFMIASKVQFLPPLRFTKPVTVHEALARYRAPKRVDQPEINLPEALLGGTTYGESIAKARERYVGRSKSREKKISRVSFSLKRLDPDKPAGAMIGPKLVHPYEPRLLSIQEMLYFSGFPLSYRLSGSPMAQASLIGRGVMPPVGAWLARHVRRAIEEGARFYGATRRAFELDLFKPPGSRKEVTDEVCRRR
jgi:site-specific DNA-cytosine methylase